MDTSALIEIPDVIQRVDPATVFVPLTVIKQLDGLKNNPDIERSKKARSASFFIDEGMKNGNVTVLTAYDNVDGLDNVSDNKIVGAAVRLKRENPEAVVALLATDRNMRIVAGGFGVEGMVLDGIWLGGGNVVMRNNSTLDKRVWIAGDTPLWARIAMVVGAVLFLCSFNLPKSEVSWDPWLIGDYCFGWGLFVGWIGFVNWAGNNIPHYPIKRGDYTRDDSIRPDITSKNLDLGITNPHNYKDI